MPSIVLTSYDTGFESESDFDAWTDFVCSHIDEKCGFEVDIDLRSFGRGTGDTYLGSEGEVETMREAMRDLWDGFCALPMVGFHVVVSEGAS